MIKNIFTTLFIATLFAAFSTAAMAQQPFDTLPAEENQQDPAQDAAQDPLQFPAERQRPSTPFSAEDSAFQDTEPDQKVEVDERYAGWRSAGEGTAVGRLSNVLRGNWVMADSNGLLTGNVRGVEGAETGGMVIYLMHMGRIVTTNVTDDQGNFRLNNVVQGAYSLVGIGENAFFAFGLNILGYSDQPTNSVPTAIYATAFQNKTSINLDWIRHFSPRVKFRVYGRYSAGEGEEDPARLYGYAGLSEFQPANAPATSISGHKVVTVSDGRLLGRIHQINSLNGRPVDIGNSKIMLLKGDNVYASTEIDNTGVFEFSGVQAGQYGLVAAGVDGLGCIGIDVDEVETNVDAEVNSGATVFDFCMVTSETVGWLNHLAGELAYERAILAPRPTPPPQNNCPIQLPKPNNPRPGLLGRFTKAVDTWFDYRFFGEVPDFRGDGSYPHPGGAFGSSTDRPQGPAGFFGGNANYDYNNQLNYYNSGGNYNSGGGYYGNGGGYGYGNGGYYGNGGTYYGNGGSGYGNGGGYYYGGQ